MMSKCLYCYQPIEERGDYHEKCSKSFFGTSLPPQLEYTFSEMEMLAKEAVERSITITGVQAKLSMGVVKTTANTSDQRLTVLDALGGSYIFKPPSKQFEGMSEVEHVTMKIAQAYGLSTVPCSLIRLASGELSYITRRVDRTKKGEKTHMIDMFQITEAFDKYRSSMEKIGKAINQYSNQPLLDNIYFFELSVFSFLTGNNDMHLKNFSLINSANGWVLAPAYDLLNVNVLLPEDEEELALTLKGKRKKLKRDHFESFGIELGLNQRQINGVFKRMIKNFSKALEALDQSFLSESLKEKYKEVLGIKYKQLGLLD
ncbi:HipA domain-containing protein [Flammeovirga kamogawensis]|nr:HipA domain-containing protein [Flammeovirga kamogawensis]